MSRLVNILDYATERPELITTDNGEAINLAGVERFSLQCVVDVDTPAAATFDSEAKATLVDQSLTYTAVDFGAAGNSITIELEDPMDQGIALDVTVAGTAITVTLETTPEATAALTDQGLTYTALAAGDAGNSITITLTDPMGNNQALDVTVVGTAIDVSLATDGGGLITSTADDVKAAVNADVEANLLVIVSGSGAVALSALATTPLAGGDDGGDLASTGDEVKAAINADVEANLLVIVSGSNGAAVSALAETPLAGGRDSEVEESGADTVDIPSHGFTTGLKGALSTTGSLPSGITGTVYVIVVDDDVVKFASSLANALLGTALTITTEGTGVHTFTPSSLAGASVTLQKSNDGETWDNVASATSISADSDNWFEVEAPTYKYARTVYAITAGRMSVVENVIAKGY